MPNVALEFALAPEETPELLAVQIDDLTQSHLDLYDMPTLAIGLRRSEGVIAGDQADLQFPSVFSMRDELPAGPIGKNLQREVRVPSTLHDRTYSINLINQRQRSQERE